MRNGFLVLVCSGSPEPRSHQSGTESRRRIYSSLKEEQLSRQNSQAQLLILVNTPTRAFDFLSFDLGFDLGRADLKFIPESQV